MLSFPPRLQPLVKLAQSKVMRQIPSGLIRSKQEKTPTLVSSLRLSYINLLIRSSPTQSVNQDLQGSHGSHKVLYKMKAFSFISGNLSTKSAMGTSLPLLLSI